MFISYNLFFFYFPGVLVRLKITDLHRLILAVAKNLPSTVTRLRAVSLYSVQRLLASSDIIPLKLMVSPS